MGAGAGSRANRPVVLTAVLAALVTAAALITVAVLRHRADLAASRAAADAPASNAAAANSDCGPVRCVVLASVRANQQEIQLLADGNGGSGRLRIGGSTSGYVLETTLSALGVRLNPESLECRDGPEAACLVRGLRDGGLIGEVFAQNGQDWRVTQKPYFSDAANIGLGNVTGDDSPEVTVVRHVCPQSQSGSARCQVSPVVAEVYDLEGKLAGCSRQHASPGQLPGWPEVRLSAGQLRSCP